MGKKILAGSLGSTGGHSIRARLIVRATVAAIATLALGVSLSLPASAAGAPGDPETPPPVVDATPTSTPSPEATPVATPKPTTSTEAKLTAPPATTTAATAAATWMWGAPTVVNPPRGMLSAIDCVANTTFCIAVDSAGFWTVFDGTKWTSLTKIPGLSSATAVACSTQLSCVAVGRGGVWASFNGNAWSTPGVTASRADFVAVSCATPTFCVGTDSTSKAAVFNGTSWGTPATVNGGTGVASIDCTTSTFCMAVGPGGKASTFNGSAWAAPKTPTTANLISVSCVGTSFCAAVTLDRLVLYRSGIWQSPLANPSAIEGNYLLSVACASSSMCLLSDGGSTYRDGEIPTVWRFNGSNWSTVVATAGEFYGPLTCASTSLCVMLIPDRSWWGQPEQLARFDGAAWAITDFPNRGGADHVACGAPAACVSTNIAGSAASTTGSMWTTEGRAFRFTDQLRSVSCASSTFCMAVGAEQDRFTSPDSMGRAAIFNGQGWTETSSPGGGYLTSVSCPTTSTCFAIDANGYTTTYRNGAWGSKVRTGSHLDMMARISCATASICLASANDSLYRLQGAAWVALAYPTDTIGDFSCAAPSFCIVMDRVGAARSWNGATWSGPSAVAGSAAVDCKSATSCVAVGGTSASTFNGSTWTPRVNVISGASFTDVSCGSATFCMATDSAGRAIPASSNTAGSPASFTVSQTAAGTATMNWTPPTVLAGQTITGYKVSRDGVDAAGQGAYTSTISAASRTFQMTRLAPGQTYTLSVQAVTSTGAGLPVSGKVTITAPAPAAFTASQTGSGIATMNWQPPAVPAGVTITGYRVARDGVDAAGQGAYWTVVPATQRTFQMTRLAVGKSYTLTVHAITSAGAGITASGTVPIVVDPPTSVTVTQTGAGAATIAWQPPAVPAGQTVTGYRVSRDGVDSAGQGAYSTTVAAGIRQFSMTRLVPGRSYTLTVQAITAAGTGMPASKPLTIVVDPPMSFTVTVTGTTAKMAWAPPAVPAGQTITGYRVTRDGVNSAGDGAYSGTVSASTRQFSFTRLVPGRTYTLTVRAITAAGQGMPATGSAIIR